MLDYSERTRLLLVALLCRATPHVFEMIARVRRMVDGSVEPANGFSLPRAE